MISSESCQAQGFEHGDFTCRGDRGVRLAEQQSLIRHSRKGLCKAKDELVQVAASP